MAALGAKVEAARREAAERLMQNLHDEAEEDAENYLAAAVVEAEHKVYREQVMQAAAQGQSVEQLLAMVDAAKSAVRSFNERVKMYLPKGSEVSGQAVLQQRLAKTQL
eukprot:3979431-Pyramimonas_sp.AAC.1